MAEPLKVSLSVPTTGNVVLIAPVRNLLAATLSGTHNCENAEQVKQLGLDVLLAILEEVSGEGGPSLINVASVTSWFESFEKPVVKVGKSKKVTYAKKTKTVDSGEETSDEEEEDDTVSLKDLTLHGSRAKNPEILKRDLASTGFTSGMQACAFEITLHSGHLFRPEECEGMVYGMDAGFSKHQKSLKRGDVVTLAKLIKDKDAAGIRAHLHHLVREYNLQGCVAEVTVLTAFTSASDEIFPPGVDDDGYVAYIAAYRRHFVGRGLPVDLHIPLVLKAMKMGGNHGAAKREVTDLKEKVNSLKLEVAELKNAAKKVGPLETTVSRLATRVGELERKSGTTPPGGENKGGKGPCHHCQGPHNVKHCPILKEEKAAAKRAKKAAGEDAEDEESD